MSGLVVRNGGDENVHYTGSQFTDLGNIGTQHLCVRTGSNPDDVVKYALTSNPLDDKYKILRMRIPDNTDGSGGKYAYIAQKYSMSISSSSLKSYTSSRSSNYTFSQTLSTASGTSLSTTIATKSTTQNPVYYATSSKLNESISTINLYSYIGSVSVISRTRLVFFSYDTKIKSITNSSSTTYIEKVSDHMTQTVTEYFSSIFLSSYTRQDRTTNIVYEYETMYYVSKSLFTITRTETSRVIDYVSSYTITIPSKTSLSTKVTTKISEYVTTSIATITQLMTTHNVNI